MAKSVFEKNAAAQKELGSESKPPLASLVLSGDTQSEAVAITDYLFMAKDLSNAYLVTTREGDVLVNTGFNTGAERTKSLFAPHRTGPLRKIIVTQSHGDHYGGVPTLREPGTEIITERRFAETRRYYQELAPYFGPRTHKLWGSTIKKDREFQAARGDRAGHHGRSAP